MDGISSAYKDPLRYPQTGIPPTYMKLLTPEDTKLLKSEQERTRASNSLGLYTENPSSLRKILASRIATFLEQEDKRVAQEDETRRLANRETLDFFTYLDMHTDYFLVELRKLSGKESLLFDAIMRIYYNECPKLREILLEKQSLQPGERGAIYENLKILIDNELISFDGVNQTGLARVVGVNQNNISGAFLSLVKKGFLVENGKQGNEKHFAPKDMDFLAFYLMRYL